MPDGDYYDDSGRTVQAGSMYGWASPDEYVSARPYTDGQTAGLEFDTDASLTAGDTYTSTYAVTAGGTWEAERTSAKGVITLKPGETILADSAYAALHDADYQTAVLIRQDGDVFRFGGEESFLKLTAENGTLTLTAQNSGKTETLTAPDAYEPGKWAVVSVVIEGDTASIRINGEQKASGDMTLDPVDTVSGGGQYLLGGAGLSMDYFRVYYKAVPDPEYTYTATEDVTELPAETPETPEEITGIYGDLNADGSVDVFDLSLLKRALLQGEFAEAADLDGDGSLTVADAIALTHALHRQDGAGRTGEAFTV